MNTTEQVKKLRENAKKYRAHAACGAGKDLEEAASTIESLSGKLQAANEELNRWKSQHVNKNIKNPLARASVGMCQNCGRKDDYIEELEAENGRKGS